MAKPGAKPKNAQLKVIQGNPSRRPIPEQPNLPALGAEAPDFLSATGKRLWNRWASSLIGLGLFADVHRELLASTVQHWATYIDCMEVVKADGVVIERKNGISRSPWLVSAENAFACARKGMSELGLTPAELSRRPGKKADGEDFFGY